MIIFFDTETTGLRPGQICQLSYLMQDKEKTVAKNFFFSVDFVEYGAYLVHGFSVDKLKALSKGRRFFDDVLEIENDFNRADLVLAHNLEFDLSFMKTEFCRLDKDFKIKKGFCSMTNMTSVCKIPRKSGCGYKYPKLTELCSFFSVSDVEINLDTVRLFGDRSNYHDARFDTTAVYLAVNKGMDTEYLSSLREYL